MAAGANPMALKRGIDKAVERAIEEIHRLSKPVKGDMIAQVGTVSANGDATIGGIIAKAMDQVGKDGVITVEESRTMETSLEVVAVGEGKYREDGTRQTLDVKAGDRVLFGKYSGSEVKLDDQEFLIMREDEILGIIQRAAAGKKSGK